MLLGTRFVLRKEKKKLCVLVNKKKKKKLQFEMMPTDLPIVFFFSLSIEVHVLVFPISSAGICGAMKICSITHYAYAPKPSYVDIAGFLSFFFFFF